MRSILLRGGQLAGLLGMLLMIVSVAVRLSGRFTAGSFEAGTLMLGGLAGVSVGCFLLIWSIADPSQR